MKGNFLLLIGCLAMVCGACHKNQRTTFSESFPVMGTVATLSVQAENEVRLRDIVQSAEREMKRLESLFSFFSPESEISRINALRAGSTRRVSTDVSHVLLSARDFSVWSEGAFDVTVGPLVRLWGIHGGAVPAVEPSPAMIAAARQKTGYRYVRAGPEWAGIDQDNVQIDVGGIAKGYAVDRTWTLLAEQGITNVLINLGGNMRCRGQPAPGRNWIVGVRHFKKKETIVGSLQLLPGMAVATSGNYERFVSIGGRRYGHIIDPRTGYPADKVAAVTVLAPTAMEADALSTALFVLGVEESCARLKSKPGISALFMEDGERMTITLVGPMAPLFTPDPTVDCIVRRR